MNKISEVRAELKKEHDGVDATVVEYSKGQNGWEIPPVDIQPGYGHTEVIFEGVGKENITHYTKERNPMPPINGHVPRKLSDFLETVKPTLIGKLELPEGHYTADVYAGRGNECVLFVILDSDGRCPFYHVISWTIPSMHSVEYVEETGGFQINIYQEK